MRLCFIGDSLIEFFDWQAHFPMHRITNLGIAGETSTGLLTRLPDVVRQNPSPDLIMIMTGTNDLLMENYGLLSIYPQILQILRSKLPQSRILVASLLPIRVPWVAPDAVIRLNNGLERLCLTVGAAFLNVHPLFLDDRGLPRIDLFLPDGIHLSDKGYTVWSVALAEQLAPPDDTPF